ncbi:MAG: 1,4-alpha-glucan branching protein GlgB [Parachlamydiales bacterium]|jgi:1,4-alpha-glucan branching enzyme
MKDIIHGISLFRDQDIYFFKEGSHYRLYEKLGAHEIIVNNQKGTLFSVWAPNAKQVSVIGNFNGWNTQTHPLADRWDSSGIWEGFVPDLSEGEIYKYHIVSKYNDYITQRADPFASYSENPPKTASVTRNLDYKWNDQEWMRNRQKYNSLESPYSIYEVHLGSWKRKGNNEFLTYEDLAKDLVRYVKEMGFTHVEFLPIMEHPFYGSWGYQATSYFSPTSRYGTPQQLMYLIDSFHQNGIGVILDWTAAHFPSDGHGLNFFDGTALYEHADPRKGFHPDWNSCIFNYGRNEIKEFLISSAIFWLHKYHVDGIRIDAVASMLYLDYSRKEGEWIPNENGGRENLEAIAFLQTLNKVVYSQFPDTQVFAEESTSWPQVTRPTYSGGLGFGFKWNMGWMHDTLKYFSLDAIFRKYHHNELTFSMLYAFNENFLLPLSHDEVVHGKGSLISKMPGDDWQKYANFRLLFGYMYTHPGKKLSFMGSEFAYGPEWNHDQSLDWNNLNLYQQKIMLWIKDLNFFYKEEKCLYEKDFDWDGFEWIDCTDYEKSILSYIRKPKSGKNIVLAVCNFTPVVRENYQIGVPCRGKWKKILNSDDKTYLGSGFNNFIEVDTEEKSFHGRPFSINLSLPPLAIVILKYFGD